MQIIKEQKLGDYYVSVVDISKDEWLEILKDETVSEKYKEAVICFYYMPDYKGSCVAVGNRLGKNAYSLVATIMNFGKYVQKRLGRFQVIDEDGKNTYWPVPMKRGKALSNKEEGNFEWTLRDELVEATKEYLMWFLVEKYKELRKEMPIRCRIDGVDYDELYKWELITVSGNKTPFEIVQNHVINPNKANKGGFTNLIYVEGDNKTLKYLIDNKSAEFQKIVDLLADDTLPLVDRLANYKASVASLLTASGFNSKANDERTAATILTCCNPDKYTFYKHDGMYDNLCKYLGEEMKPAGQCYQHYLDLIQPVATMASNDKELQDIVSPMLESQRKSDLLLAQDMVWMVLCWMPKRLGFLYPLVWPSRKRLWLWSGDQETAKQTMLCCGSSAKTIKDFRPFKSKNALLKAYQDDVGNQDVNIPTAYWNFVHEVNSGDIVVVFKSKTDGGKRFHLLYGWGKFTSDCIFEETNDDPMCRSVEWHLPFLKEPVEDKALGNSLFFHGTTDKQAQHIIELLNIETENFSEIMNTKLQPYIDLLRANHNLILTGAPGTGKTHLAKEIAEEMGAEVGFVQFHPSYDYTDFVEGLRPVQDRNGNVGFERRDGVFKLFCKKALMPQDDALYQDAIDKFKKDIAKVGTMTILTSKTSTPFNISLNSRNTICVVLSSDDTWSATDKNLIDYLKTGLYDAQHDTYLHSIGDYIKKTYLPTVIARQDHDDESTPFVFIIDEINRGEISKIFGELFFSIDPGYRGEKGRVDTQYQNMVEEGDVFKKGFYVPDNVYIIGTMNDIDRSVESMDFAMRRRFAWLEITAEESMQMLIGMPNEEELKNRMCNLNNAILKINGLGKAYQIGAAYFLKYKQYDDFELLWKYHLEGLLREYLRGNPNAEQQLDELKKAYNISDSAPNESGDNHIGQ